MKQGNRSQGSRGVSDGQAGGRSGKPSRRGGTQDNVSAARRSLGKQGKRNELGKQGSRHASREDGRPGEGAVAGAGRRGSQKTHGSGMAAGASNRTERNALEVRASRKARDGSGKGARFARRSPRQHLRPSRRRPQGSLPPRSAFLPVSRADMEERGWDCCDFVYRVRRRVRRPSLVRHGHHHAACLRRNHYTRWASICQPDWRDPESVAVLGKPRLGFLVSAGNMDSMVNHYTRSQEASQHRRATRPAARRALRPDRAAVGLRKPDPTARTRTLPIVLGGIEAIAVAVWLITITGRTS